MGPKPNEIKQKTTTKTTPSIQSPAIKKNEAIKKAALKKIATNSPLTSPLTDEDNAPTTSATAESAETANNNTLMSTEELLTKIREKEKEAEKQAETELIMMFDDDSDTNEDTIISIEKMHDIIGTTTSTPQQNKTQLVSQETTKPPPAKKIHYEKSPLKSPSSPPQPQKQKKGAEKYGPEDEGPYTVLMQYIKVDEKTPLYEMRTGRILQGINNKLEVAIKKIARTRNKLTFKKREEANEILESTKLAKHNLRAYIPEYILITEGVVSNVPPEITETEIKQELEQKYKIKKVEKIKRYDNKTKSFRTTNCVKITFLGKQLPEHVSIYYGRHQVSHYVYKPKICNTCFRYGHSTTKCNRTEKCCEFCGKTGHAEINCKETHTCFYCKLSDHCTTDKRICAEYKKQLKINNLMAAKKLTFNEAAEEFERINRNYAKAMTYTEADFPKLGENRCPTSQGKTQETTTTKEIIHKPQRQVSNRYEPKITPRTRAKTRWDQEVDKGRKLVTGDPFDELPLAPMNENRHKVLPFERLVTEFQSVLSKVCFTDEPESDVAKLEIGSAMQKFLFTYGKKDKQQQKQQQQSPTETITLVQ
jgi:hypothetical protein